MEQCRRTVQNHLGRDCMLAASVDDLQAVKEIWNQHGNQYLSGPLVQGI